MAPVEVRFLRDWQNCKAGETKTLNHSSQTIFTGKDGKPCLNIICNSTGDHAGINLRSTPGLNLEILESGQGQVKVDTKFAQLRVGDQIRLVDDLGIIAEICHQPLSPALSPEVRSSFIEKILSFMRRR